MKRKNFRKVDDKVRVAEIKAKRLQNEKDRILRKEAKELEEKLEALEESKKLLFGLKKSNKVKRHT